MTNKKIRSVLKNKRLEMSREDRDMGSYKIQKKLFLWISNIAAKSLKIGNIIQVTTFWPMPLEPNIIWLNNKLTELDNVKLSLPVTKDSDKYLEFKEWNRSISLIKGKYGILEPDSKYIITRPDIILVPTLGYSNTGDRIGYGSGYYDRTLSELISKKYRFVTIGIAWDHGLIEGPYKAASHDIKLDAIITPRGWVKNPPE
ncbi:5-formyltetrahydrofolate cyclo-ligase [Candidatus Kinetoplastidibacterium galati]|uniref:5-formyltetrahydrofolate cyclo-ligase n=1 Tax=Candidatus Kinetoplastidibacterium galati TCC219 TaxID=1208921 RepID=M1LZ85_9PROT|nr:5-formyltetrahydrofolate cyclo-ligase [Candidatus Kinetoplastibacterium galatii]AGF49376.1 5-formyltetrahydrofolate cyclo-ligase [Candidatus Kinetoplastibacterium galatii TCC219]